MKRHLIGFLLWSSLLLVSADPPFLFPHGYFDSAKLKPFDAIYLNLMAQSNLEYGGITLEDLDKLDASRKLVERPANLPRTREEDDIILDREPIPLDTDAIAPGPKKKPSDDDGPPSLSSLGQSALPQPTAALSIEPSAPVARPMPTKDKENKKEQRVAEFDSNRPRSPFSRIRLLQRRAASTVWKFVRKRSHIID